LKKTKLIITFLLLAAISLTYAQGKRESLKIIWENESLQDSVRFKTINDFYENNTQSDPDSSLKLSAFHYKLAKQKKNRKEEARALNEKAIVFYMLGYKLDKINPVYQEVLGIYTELKNYNGLASTKNNLAGLFQQQGDYQSAINNFTDALALFKTQKNNMGVADVLNNIAGIYQSVELYKLALPYYNEAITIYRKEGAEEKAGFYWLNTAIIYAKIGQTKTAKKNFEKAYSLFKAKNDVYYLPEYFYHMAYFYKNSGNTQSASIMIEKGIKILTETGNNHRIISFKLFKAELVLDSDVAQAFRIAQELKEPILEATNKSYKSALFQLLYNCYKKQKKFELALQMNENYLIYADSVLIDKNKIAIVSEALQADYQAKLVDNQLVANKKEAQLKLKQLKLIYSLILIGGLIILSLFFYFRLHTKKNQAKRDLLLDEITKLKNNANKDLMVVSSKFELVREKIEHSISRKLNETDWKVLTILLEDPAVSNKEIADMANMSVDGIGSSLRRMYEYFEIKESKYKKISLLLEAIKLSNNSKIGV
jgi:tetratricopeptide (TPR) repeat protein